MKHSIEAVTDFLNRLEPLFIERIKVEVDDDTCYIQLKLNKSGQLLAKALVEKTNYET